MSIDASDFDGYQSKTIIYKSVNDIDLKLDVFYPAQKQSSPRPCVIHYHGGFLVMGDRYAFFPHWLVQACVNRNWIFISPEYRLLPETTAHDSVQDSVDAYLWITKSLSSHIDIQLGPVVVAGSSAGGYLSLAVSSLVSPKPASTVSIYGMLDPSNKRYTTPGTNILNLPAFDTSSALDSLRAIKQERSPVFGGYALPADLFNDPRMKIILTLHIEALFPDYLTGLPGLSKAIAAEGVEAIPSEHRKLFPLDFSGLDLPATILVHGQNDSAVSFEQSQIAEARLRKNGVTVYTEFPKDGEHGFDVKIGKIDVEKEVAREDLQVASFQGLRNFLRTLDEIVQNASAG